MIDESWALLCELGFWGWVLAAAGFFLYAFPRRGTFRSGVAVLFGGGFLSCFALWVLGMLKA